MSVSQLLMEVTVADMSTLPSGLSLYALLLDANREQSSTISSTDPFNPLSSTQVNSGLSSSKGSVNSLSWVATEAVTGARAAAGAGTWGSNALVEILQRIPPGDLEALQRGVEMASSSFRYYQYNSSLRLHDKDIPTRCTYFHIWTQSPCFLNKLSLLLRLRAPRSLIQIKLSSPFFILILLYAILILSILLCANSCMLTFSRHTLPDGGAIEVLSQVRYEILRAIIPTLHSTVFALPC